MQKKKQLLSLPNILLMSVFVWLVAFYAVVASAAQVTLRWDANDPVPDGYRLYQRLEGEQYNYTAAAWDGQTTTCIVEGLEYGKTYYFVVRAFSGGDMSADSNQVMYTTPLADSGGSDTGNPLPSDPPPTTDPDPGGDGSYDQGEAGPPNSGGGAPVNSAPYKPFLSLPPNGVHNILLTPVLTTQDFADPDGDRHARTTYQISTVSDFLSLVFERTFSSHLIAVRVPDLVLDPDTTYYWRVKFHDDRQAASEWSDPFQFRTIDYVAAGDSDGNGILDEQEFDFSWNDSVSDVLRSGLAGVVTPDGYNRGVAVVPISENVHLAGIIALDIEDLPLTNQPANLTSPISFKLLLQDDILPAKVKVLFSEPAPYDAMWFEFDLDEGWKALPEAEFSQDRKSLTLNLEDGGPRDQDGVLNGIIVAPSGMGSIRQASDASTYTAKGEAAGPGCFIGISFKKAGNRPAAAIFLLTAAACALFSLGTRPSTIFIQKHIQRIRVQEAKCKK